MIPRGNGLSASRRRGGTPLCGLMQAAMLFSALLIPGRLIGQVVWEGLKIEVTGESREFAYTNKESAFFYGETKRANTTSWQGFNVFGHEFLDDYILLINGVEVPRSSALKTAVYPDYLSRVYKNGVTEELRLVDSLALFAVIISAPKPVDVAIIPLFTDGRKSEDYEVKLSGATALVAVKHHLARTARENYPVWLAIHGSTFTPVQKPERRGSQFSAVRFVSGKGNRHVIAFGVADRDVDAETMAKGYEQSASSYYRARRARMERLLTESSVETSDKRFDKALAWAKLSLDALIMNQVAKGIFAGLPWFNNYWGRDTFISLPGATLVTGHFDEARQILRSFAAFQQTDSTSTDYGRIPNIVTTTDKAYNTADGTPRFVMMAREYVERSGDTTFLHEVYPTVKRSIEGTLRYHCDSLGFLTHADAETWMDAVGPDGPWSPRGNRANDIQALWAQQLDAGVWFATLVGDAGSARGWNAASKRLKQNFSHYFLLNGVVSDHLNKDGSRDVHVRPNQIFTSYLLDDSTRERVARTVTTDLTYEYGVASLSQGDENFHPYHQNDPFYPKDAAYHNGTVWTWVQGALISELCHLGQRKTAWKVTSNSVSQILDRGAVGTQSELLDAIPRPGEKAPRLSGTFSQAWNLAEFIRNFYDDYLGIRVTRLTHHLVLRPMLPEAITRVKAVINLNGRPIPLEITRGRNGQTVSINSSNLVHGGTATIVLPLGDGRSKQINFALPPQRIAKIQIKNSDITLSIDGHSSNYLSETIDLYSAHSASEEFPLATPNLRPGLRSLRGPDYPTMEHTQIKAANPSAKPLVDASDPERDDIGPGARGSATGGYKYPENPSFVPGSFDVTHFTVAVDETQAYFTLKFRALSNPGWHPEYGFQLTYAAIAIDEDGVPGSGQRVVPHNANFALDERNAFEKLLLIGGGVRLEDKNGKILLAYIPTSPDAKNPLGNSETGTISFALPLAFLGKPAAQWRFTVLAGAQDDHGGAGIGEFRTVNKEVGEWNGGGKQKPDDPNIFDILTVPQE